jgi:coenzyme F420-reducing hydrogenase gamma subunit
VSVRLAVVPLSSCDGCQYNLLNEEFLDLLKGLNVKLVSWPLLGLGDGAEMYDIALVEGSVMSSRDLKTLLDARRKSRVLVAMGACALLGGVQAWSSNSISRKLVSEAGFSRPINHYVKVDHYVRGCPVNVGEMIKLLKSLISGDLIYVGSRRFNYVSRDSFKISGSLLEIETSKCVVCGRCVEVCSLIGARALNYVFKGIQTNISTPYQESLESAGCVNCGLCFAYCPVGAVSLKTRTEDLLDKIREGFLRTAYVEPEALASLMESDNLELGQVISAIKQIGFTKVFIYSNLCEAKNSVRGEVLARSPVEFSILSKQVPEHSVYLLTPRIPQDSIYVSQCVSWRNVVNSLTTRELQSLIRELGTEELDSERPDGVVGYGEDIIVVSELKDVRKALSNPEKPFRKIVFEACPGGCLLGGGQSISKYNDLTKVLVRRRDMLKKITTGNLVSQDGERSVVNCLTNPTL